MFKMIIKGFLSNKAGKYYLATLLFVILSNILLNIDANLYIISLIASVLHIIAIIYYARYLKVNFLIMIILVGLLFLPVELGGAFSSWIVFLYFAGKNYTKYSFEE